VNSTGSLSGTPKTIKRRAETEKRKKGLLQEEKKKAKEHQNKEERGQCLHDLAIKSGIILT